MVLSLLGLAQQRYGSALEHEQEIAAALAECVFTLYAMESALLRAGRLLARNRGEAARDMAAVLLHDGLAKIDLQARVVLPACAGGSELRTHLEILQAWAGVPSVNTIALRRSVAARLLEAGRLVV
jgi:hypothetical protein